MSDKKISQLPALTIPTDGDILPVVNGGNSKQITTANLRTYFQANITSVGTLTSLSVTGNVAAGNVSGTLLTGTLATAAQPNITSVGTLTSLSVTGNANITGSLTVSGNIAGNINGYPIGYRDIPQTRSGNVTIETADSGKHYWSLTGNSTITIPNNTSSSLTIGTTVEVITQSGNVVLAPDTGVTLYVAGIDTSVKSCIVTNDKASLLKVATDTWFVNGATVAPVYNSTQNTYHNTISDAIAAASNNDIIEVSAGTYQEQFNIDKPLTIRGPNYNKAGNDPTRGDEAIIQYYAALGEGNSLVAATSDNVTIEGLTFECPDSLLTATPTPILYPYTVSMSPRNNFTFRNNRVYSGEVGVYIYQDTVAKSGLLIENNYVNGGPFVNDRYNRGILVWNSSGTIRNNVIENTNIGIQFSVDVNITLAAPTTITGNTISAALYGLYNNVMPKGTAQHNWTLNTVTVAPNDRLGLKKIAGGAGAPWGSLGQTNWAAAMFAYIGTQGASATPPTVVMTNNLFTISRDTNKVYNNSGWLGLRFTTGNTGGGIAGSAVLDITNNSITNWTIAAVNLGGANANLANNWWGTTNQGSVTTQNTGGGSITLAPISTNGVAGLPSTASFLP
jgi:hypothetical protein